MKKKIKLLTLFLISCIFLLAFKPVASKHRAAPAPPVSIPDYLSMKRADSIVRNLFTDLPSNQGLWYSQVDFLRSQHYVLDYFKRSNAVASTVGTIVDSMAFVNVGITGKGRMVLGSWVKKVRLTPSSPVTTDNFAVSLYMETSDLATYNTWVGDIAIFTRGRIKSQVTPFDETWSIVDTDPKFLYYTITYKVLNNYTLNAIQVTSFKPIIYSVELRRFYKP